MFPNSRDFLFINANASMVVGNWVDYMSHMLSKESTFGPMFAMDLKSDFLHPKVLPLYQVVSRGLLIEILTGLFL